MIVKGLYSPAITEDDRPKRRQRYWQGPEGREHARAATRKLLAELGLAQATTDEIAAAQLTGRHFERHGLAAMLRIVYGSLAYEALADLYPELRPWQMGKAPAKFWSGPEGRTHAREAVAWLLDQVGLARAPEEVIYERVTYETFRTYHLTAVLSKVYRAGVRAALTDYVESRN